MATLFCCGNVQPYKSASLIHDDKFRAFTSWAEWPRATAKQEADKNVVTLDLESSNIPYVVQHVRQVNYGPLESVHYFAKTDDPDQQFREVTKADLIQANFQKLNSYKNFKCTQHDKFFEVNLYQKDPVNKHHWRRNVARPAEFIDL